MDDGVGGDDGVDVLAYDRYADRTESERKRRQRVSIATYALVAVVVGYGVLQAQLLLSFLGAVAVLVVRFLVVPDERAVETVYRAVEAGRGEEIVRAHEHEAGKRSQMRTALVVIVMGGVLAYGYVSTSFVLSAIVAVALSAGLYVTRSDPDLPRVVEEDVYRERAERRFELAGDDRS